MSTRQLVSSLASKIEKLSPERQNELLQILKSRLSVNSQPQNLTGNFSRSLKNFPLLESIKFRLARLPVSILGLRKSKTWKFLLFFKEKKNVAA